VQDAVVLATQRLDALPEADLLRLIEEVEREG
jgi:hypothetical protein